MVFFNWNFISIQRELTTSTIHFHITEAAAAKEAGIKVALLVRDGNGPLTDEEKAEYQLFSSFDEINLEFVIGKRKLDEILTTEVNWDFHYVDLKPKTLFRFILKIKFYCKNILAILYMLYTMPLNRLSTSISEYDRI